MSVRPKIILVATDGSDESHHAIELGVDMAGCMGAALHLVHIGLLSPWVHPDTLSAHQYQQLKDEAQERLDGEVAFATSAGGSVAETHLRMGRADAEVIRLSEEIPADLILVGSRGRNAIKRILLGSDAESIARHAPCSVMIVRNE